MEKKRLRERIKREAKGERGGGEKEKRRGEKERRRGVEEDG